MQIKAIQTARAYVGTLPWKSREDQAEACRAAVESLGLPPLTRIYGPAEWRDFIRDLCPADVAVLARMHVIDERPLAPGERPGGTFLLRAIELDDACAFVYVEDVQPGAREWLRSTDRAAWRALLERVHYQITRGRDLSPDRAAEIARRSHDPDISTRPPGLARHWLEQKDTPLFERIRQHWVDPTRTAREAIAEAPEEAGALSTASVSMWTRVFGPKGGGAKKRNARSDSDQPNT